MAKSLERSVETLKLEKSINNNLKSNNINTIRDLCKYSRIELTDLGISHPQINDISVSLQLLGLDLKKNHAKRNTTVDLYVKNKSLN